MDYRYEMHCHCSQGSRCGKSTSQEMVRAYCEAGYAGLVLTDHFIYGNTAIDRALPWEQRMRGYWQAYLDAKEAAKELDFDVIFGIEHQYGSGKEVLLYGIDLEFLLQNPDLPEITVDEFVRRVQACGGIAVQAHPYRNRDYIDMSVEPRRDLVDGIEVYNACSAPGEDSKALPLAHEKDYLIISGGDIHFSQDARIGMAGIVLPYRVRDEKELVQALKRRDYRCIVKGAVVEDILPEMLE